MDIAISNVDVPPPHVQRISVQRARVSSEVESSVSCVVSPGLDVKVRRVVKCEIVDGEVR